MPTYSTHYGDETTVVRRHDYFAWATTTTISRYQA
jgi:hypothetical protein